MVVSPKNMVDFYTRDSLKSYFHSNLFKSCLFGDSKKCKNILQMVVKHDD